MKKSICAVIAAVIALTAALCGCASSEKTSSEEASASGSVTNDETLADSTVSTTGNKIHISDGTLGDIWITELEGVEKNTLNKENFTSDKTFKYYSENGKPASTEGIDISSFSGDIDWEKVKEAGVDFVMVRLGGRGYGEDGAMYADERALEYIKGAQAVGIKAGGYFFSQAISSDEAAEEAKGIIGEAQAKADKVRESESQKTDRFLYALIKRQFARTNVTILANIV